jgi:hypothetical protein
MVSINNTARADELKSEYERSRATYEGGICDPLGVFDVECISHCLSTFKHGKASGLDDIADEHLLFAHPMLIVALTKLFNLMLFVSAVPHSFTNS